MRAPLPALIPALILLLVPVVAGGHGIWGHVHVTGWAIEDLPAGELRDFFDEPEVMNAALFGAAFTDSGYWPQGAIEAAARAYSEHTHWEPFVEDAVRWIRENDPPPWTDLESRKRVAFVLGCAAHGLQDEVFDSLFLFQVQEHDDAGQAEADPGTDGFLVLDGEGRFEPTEYVPTEMLLELYQVLGHEITADTLSPGIAAVRTYIDPVVGKAVAETLGTRRRDRLPWTRAHYLDPDIPGSLRSEIVPTIAYLEAVWERMHARFGAGDLVVAAYPAVDRRLLGWDAGSPDSWVTFVFGVGARPSTTAPAWWTDDGERVDFGVESTRWGNVDEWSRLVRLLPAKSLEPGAWYRVRLGQGAERIDEQADESAFERRFQVSCSAGDPSPCEVAVDRTDAAPEAVPEPPTAESQEPGGCSAAGPAYPAGMAVLLVLVLLAAGRFASPQR